MQLKMGYLFQCLPRAFALGIHVPHAWRPKRAKALYGDPNMIYKPKKK